MKFGEYLRQHMDDSKKNQYLNYDLLKKMIFELEEKEFGQVNNTDEVNIMSLTIPLPTNAAAQPVDKSTADINQEKFFAVLEEEIRKIQRFTKEEVDSIRNVIQKVEEDISKYNIHGPESVNTDNLHLIEGFKSKLSWAGEEFLKLEKFVNLNFTGFHKILKKHDRRLPNPCKNFYMARLREQSWVRGDYSDVIVSLSRAYGALRGDDELEEQNTEKQAFIRSTRKYWVHTENISHVKYIILQHLPVFLQKTMAGETDSQLINSIYLDNTLMELYQGRLEKSPGAIALRMRWYGTGTPETVFVERKTHRESWTGEVSVKERFIISEEQVLNILAGKFDIETEKLKLVKKGKSQDEIDEWLQLVVEVTQAISSKQLIPTMRTQYMRTAFQIPFDASVRISLDTNLCMITERTKEQLNGTRWFRDPKIPVPPDQITRLPYAVLEIKLQLLDEADTPSWVSDLISSGMLMEVHKFSKFIHGCAVLLHEEVSDVPYWIDDVTLVKSITISGAASIIQNSSQIQYSHVLPHNAADNISTIPKFSIDTSKGKVDYVPRNPTHLSGYHAKDLIQYDETPRDLCDFELTCCNSYSDINFSHVTHQKVEPKVFFANERTFIKWLQMAVMMSSISIGILAFTKSEGNAHYFAVMLLPISLLFIFYALKIFLWRSTLIRIRASERWDDPIGPIILSLLLIFSLSGVLLIKIIDLDIWD